MTEFNWEAFSQEFKDKYNKIRSIPGLGANVRNLTELIFLCIEESERQRTVRVVDIGEDGSMKVRPDPVKRRGRPPKGAT